MKQRFFLLILVVVLAIPSSSFADPLCPATAPTAGTFNPNDQVPSGYGSGSNSFSGLNFSGVGGALAACLNVGGKVFDLFGVEGVDTNKIPVVDKKTNTELSQANRREQCLNGVAYGVAKNLLQTLTNKTVNWAKTGFDGNPFYVRDIDSYLQNIGNEKIQDFLVNVPETDPIFGIALRSAITQQVSGYTDGRLTKVMNTPEAKAYEDFQDDFTQGGWDAFLNPQNNPVGAYFKATDRLGGILNTAKQNVKEELVQGSGFLSMKKCAEYDAVGTAAGNGATDQASCTANYTAKKTVDLATCDSQTNPLLKTNCINTITQKYSALLRSCTTLTVADPNAKRKCLRYETVTPGDLISKQVGEVINSPVNQLIAADSINEVLGGFFDSFVNNLFSKGLGGSGGARNADIRGLNTVTGSNGTALPGVAETQSTLGLQNTCSTGYSGDFDISRPQQLRAVIKAQKDYLNHITDSNIVVASIIPELGKLDYCLPGPNPTWESGLEDNYNAFLGSFRKSSTQLGIPIPIVPVSVDSNKFASDPALFDKTTNATRRTRHWEFDGDDSVSIFSGQDLNSLLGFLSNGWNDIQTYYHRDFEPMNQKMVTAFQNLFSSQVDKNLAGGNITQSLKETANLPNYAQIVPQYQTFYGQSIEATNQSIAELELINTEMLRIVGIAKARYIQEQENAGTPVDKACLNDAYVVDLNPILGAPRSETALPNPDIQLSKDASTYFYSHL